LSCAFSERCALFEELDIQHFGNEEGRAYILATPGLVIGILCAVVALVAGICIQLVKQVQTNGLLEILTATKIWTAGLILGSEAVQDAGIRGDTCC
jgi:hypothetical protein